MEHFTKGPTLSVSRVKSDDGKGNLFSEKGDK